MKKYKILNLYACLGGNRYKWDEVLQEADLDYEITAVELDPELARMYQERFTNDIVIIADAHQYLLEHFKEYDFIWTSPPCPTHSRARFAYALNYNTSTEAVYPDMVLYQEILLLMHYFKTGKYVVENVISYYDPLIPAQKRGRHFYWCNFILPKDLSKRFDQAAFRGKDEFQELCKFHKIDLTGYSGAQNSVKIARNLVDYEAGKAILSVALNAYKDSQFNQGKLF